ncbi:MAG: 2-amino-4-hydroxy-6-hydroxymethyldihydropteridine diphosphokinase [Helicobacteraceae bacterium]|nr:2-amino-4-hydroxy-6-hydroxymethyldihydropteridine diphosphokinase [Helicobacteraceae bacterium]
MQKREVLCSELTLYYSELFGSTFTKHRKLRYEAVVGIGGNIGNVKTRFKHLLFKMKRDRQIELLQTSPILKNPPFGFVEQGDFYNGVIKISTSMQPLALLDYLLRLERQFGRRRSFANAPRTLDLDLIFFEKVKMKHKKLILPHPAWSDRESVVIPLSFINYKRGQK